MASAIALGLPLPISLRYDLQKGLRHEETKGQRPSESEYTQLSIETRCNANKRNELGG